VLVVLSARESRVHGEGAQALFILANREEHVICAYLQLVWVYFRKPVSLSFMENEREQVYHEGNNAGKPCAVKVASTVWEETVRNVPKCNALTVYFTTDVSLRTPLLS
jgi:hypothetical protein